VSSSITKIANVIIPTADQERALAFYTGMLGMEKRVELSFGEGSRWIEVAPPRADTSIAICPPGPGVTPGGRDTGIALHTPDIDAFHAQLKKAGVDVDAEVGRFGEGVPAVFWLRDPEGNVLMVSEAQ
jgi:predicted enzyme related to lactoylglutathione lyase